MARIIVVDDHQIILNGISNMLGKVNGIDIVASCTNAEDCIAQTAKNKPDVILMDISMKNMSGIECTAQIKASYPSVKIIALTSFHREATVRAMLEAGADGYLLKSANQQQIIRAIDDVMAGKRHLDFEIAAVLKGSSLDSPKAEPTPKETFNLESFFTKRELEVFDLILNDKTTPEISNILGVAQSTVLSHRKNIYHKTEVHSTTGLIRFAVRNGIGL